MDAMNHQNSLLKRGFLGWCIEHIGLSNRLQYLINIQITVCM